MRSIKPGNVVAAVACFGVLGIHVVLLIRYATNIPFMDDYNTVLNFIPDLLKAESWAGKYHQFVDRHLEHAIVVNRLIIYAQYLVSGGVNLKVLIFVGNTFFVLLFVLIVRMFQPSVQGNWIFFLPVPFFLFNLSSHENFFWAMASIQNFGVIFFGFLSLYVLVREPLTRGRLLWSIALAGLSLLSSGNGFLVFIVGLGLLVWSGAERGNVIIWFAASVLFIALYFYGYKTPPHHPDPFATLTHKPDQVMSFLFALVGSNFTWVGLELALALFSGFFITICFVMICIKGGYREEYLNAGLLLFLFGSIGLMAVSRGGEGFGYAVVGKSGTLVGHYSIYSALLLILLYHSILRLRLSKKYSYLVLTGFTLLSVGSYASAFAGHYPVLKDRYRQQIHAVACFNEHNTRYYLPYPSQEDATRILSEGESLNVYKLPALGYSQIQSELVSSSAHLEETGNINVAMGFEPNSKLIFVDNSWAYIERLDATDSRTYGVFQSESKTFVFDTYRHWRHDVTMAFGGANLDYSGFSLILSANEIPPGRYRFGLLIKHPSGVNAFKYTGHVLTREGTTFSIE